MSLTLTVLGCHGSFPGRGGAGSGYLIRGGGVNVWLDCGPGTFANLQQHVGIADIDAIVVTHEHPDHRSDLEGFAVANEYFLRRRDFPVHAPAGVFEHGYHTGAPAIEANTIADGDEWKIGSLAFRASRTDHGPTTMAVRVEAGGRSLAFSADTGPAWSLDRLGDPVDVALLEASYTQAHESTELHHLSGRQAGEMARAGGARRLVLTHFWPTLDRDAIRAEAESTYGAPVEVASIGATFDI